MCGGGGGHTRVCPSQGQTRWSEGPSVFSGAEKQAGHVLCAALAKHLPRSSGWTRGSLGSSNAFLVKTEDTVDVRLTYVSVS